MIWEQFVSRVKKYPDRTALRWQGKSLSYQALADVVDALATHWFDVGLKTPCRAVVRQADSLSIALSLLACWRAGVTVVLMRESATDAQLQELVAMLRPAAVLATPVQLDALPAKPSVGRPRAAMGPRSEGLVISTSGTTGAAKLVALPAESVCINATTIGGDLGLTPDDRVAVMTPLTYVYGLVGGLITGLWAGATVHLFSPRQPLSVTQGEIRRNDITLVQGAPSLMRLFLSYWNGQPFPSVRLLTTGGEYLSPDVVGKLGEAFPNARKVHLFGMTEAGPRICHDDLASGRYANRCVGKPFKHLEWQIEPGESPGVGRLMLRGPTIFLGYLQPSGAYEGLDAEGFFHSSDLCSTDADGWLYYHGRADRMFKTGGKLINPSAIEAVLAQHPDVEDALCTAKPHDILGLVPVADVVLKAGHELDRAGLDAHCAKYLDAHAVPKEIGVVTGWKLAESGKSLRH